MNKLVLILTPFLFSFKSFGQSYYPCLSYSPLEKAEEGSTLTFDQTSGAEGAGVAYNPNEHLYYAITGGNAFMPFETFDTLGNSLNQTNAGYFALGYGGILNSISKGITGRQLVK